MRLQEFKPASYKGMTAVERYLHDPHFHALVDTMRSLLRENMMDVSDFMQAANLASGLHDRDALSERLRALSKTGPT